MQHHVRAQVRLGERQWLSFRQTRMNSQPHRTNAQRWPRPSEDRAAQDARDAQESQMQADRDCAARMRARSSEATNGNGKGGRAGEVMHPRGGKEAASPILNNSGKGNSTEKEKGAASPTQIAPKQKWLPKIAVVSNMGVAQLEQVSEQREIPLSQDGNVTGAAATAKDETNGGVACQIPGHDRQ